MKKILLSFVIAVLLAGCAASAYKSARGNANLIKNDMTLAQAIDILGIPPTHQTGTYAEWRRGNAQTYDATPSGAIRVHLKDGLIVDVPEGGVFGPEARRLYIEQRNALRAEQTAADERELAAQAAAAQAERKAAAMELEAEAQAAASANVACMEKSTCSKVFSLAQIYLADNADQKIQVVTDTIIQTYNPTEVGMIGATIVKMPQRGDSALVSMSLSCKVTDNYPEAQSLCRTRRTAIYKGFRPFIERQLVP
jgi:hypothetical protein